MGALVVGDALKLLARPSIEAELAARLTKDGRGCWKPFGSNESQVASNQSLSILLAPVFSGSGILYQLGSIYQASVGHCS